MAKGSVLEQGKRRSKVSEGMGKNGSGKIIEWSERCNGDGEGNEKDSIKEKFRENWNR